MAFLYKVRASAFRDQESDKFKALDSKRQFFGEKANLQREVKNSTYDEVKRLKDQRLARKKAEFQAKKDRRMNQVNKLDKVSTKSSKIDSPKNKRTRGERAGSKKQERKNKKNRPNVTIDRKRNKI